MRIDFRDGERNIDVRNIDWWHLICALTRDQTHNLGMCSDWESNLWPFWFTGQCSNQVSHTGQGWFFFVF